jgi:hypothetical protein
MAQISRTFLVPVSKNVQNSEANNEFSEFFFRFFGITGFCASDDAPASLNGLAHPHPYMEQEIFHICLVLTHSAIDTPTTGSLL